MSPVNSMFVCIIKKIKLSANLFLKWPISIIGKMLNIGADNRSTPNEEEEYRGKETMPSLPLFLFYQSTFSFTFSPMV